MQILGFHAMSWKTWTWVPILEDLGKTNTKTWILMQAFGSNHGFSSRTHEYHILFLKPNFKAMHGFQNMLDHAMQLDEQ